MHRQFFGLVMKRFGSDGTGLKPAQTTSRTSMLSAVAIGLAMVGLAPSSASSQGPVPGVMEHRHQTPATETTTRLPVLRSILHGGRTEFPMARRPAPTTVQVYQYAAPPAHAPVFHPNTIPWHAPSPLPPGHAQGFSYPLTSSAPIPIFARGAAPAHRLEVTIYFASPTPATQYGTWTDGAAPMNPPWLAPAPQGPVPSGPWNGQTCQPMDFAAWTGQQQQRFR